MAVYRTIGRPVAWVARRSRMLRIILQPLFDQALARAAAHFYVRPADFLLKK
jgi:hypothetical protein